MAATAPPAAGQDNLADLRERVRAEFFQPSLVGNHYEVESVIGQGSYGVVVSALETNTGTRVAVKRITNVFDDLPEAVRTLRELKFLRLLKDHENIISLRDVLLPQDPRSFNDVFLVQELMPTDLMRVMHSRIELSADHVRWLAYQLLRGVHHIHAANVFHRDLKPSNILINAMCDLRICDFGLARAARDDGEDNQAVFWTDYVATRWYRAPELIMTNYTHYTTAIDMWSLGLIIAEMFNNGRPLFPGVNALNQLDLITAVTGTPTEAGLRAVRNPNARNHLASMDPRMPKPLSEVLARVDDPQALSLLSSILTFDPDDRISAADALSHPYFACHHTPSGALETPMTIPLEEFEFERQNLSIDDVRLLFVEEILKYHPNQRDSYLAAPGAPVLAYDQAGRFGEAMRAREQNLAAPPPHASMPNQRLGGLMDEVYAAHVAQAETAGSNPAAIPPYAATDWSNTQASYTNDARDVRSSTMTDDGSGMQDPDSQMSLSTAHRQQRSETAEMEVRNGP